MYELGQEYGAYLDAPNYTNPWHHNGYKAGYVKAPHGEMPIFLIVPLGDFDTYIFNELLGPGVGVLELPGIYDGPILGSCGIFESRPAASGPGDFLYGTNLDQDANEFFEAQDVNPMVALDVSFLSSQHIDQALSISSDGNHIMVVDPEVCWALLMWAGSINSNATMYVKSNPSKKVGDIVGNGSLREDNLEENTFTNGLSTFRNGLGLTSPETDPCADSGNTGDAELSKAGAFIGFLTGDANDRNFRITFTSSTEYEVEYSDDSGESWDTDVADGNRLEDCIFKDALCFIYYDRWTGTPDIGDVFTFEVNPDCNTIEIPVLFNGSSCYTVDHVNCLVGGDTVFTGDSFGPVVDYLDTGATDILEDYLTAIFGKAGISNVVTVDSRIYEENGGSVHCGTNARREIPTYNWWEFE